MNAPVPKVRLDRLLANMGYGSRKDIQAMIKHGLVTLDQAALTDAGQHIAIAADLVTRMRVGREPLDPPPGVVLMMHKPLGVTCSHKEAGPLVYGLLSSRMRQRKPAISTVGRLDKETSGLLLLTDDGGLLHRIIAPKSNVAKCYRATLARPLRGGEADTLASGTLMLDGEDKPLLPVHMQIGDETPVDTPTVYVTLHEGRYHQVRRMFAALGNHVSALHRTRIGGLALADDLAPGGYRVLSPRDVELIFV
jgi:16S rRNA pseudouridine516 synthase